MSKKKRKTHSDENDWETVVRMKSLNEAWKEIFKAINVSPELETYYKKRYELYLEYMGLKK